MRQMVVTTCCDDRGVFGQDTDFDNHHLGKKGILSQKIFPGGYRYGPLINAILREKTDRSLTFFDFEARGVRKL